MYFCEHGNAMTTHARGPRHQERKPHPENGRLISFHESGLSSHQNRRGGAQSMWAQYASCCKRLLSKQLLCLEMASTHTKHRARSGVARQRLACSISMECSSKKVWSLSSCDAGSRAQVTPYLTLRPLGPYIPLRPAQTAEILHVKA